MQTIATRSSLDLLSAALSAATTFEVEFEDTGENVLRLHELTAAIGRVSQDETETQNPEYASFSISIQTMEGVPFVLTVRSDMTVAEIKETIEAERSISVNEQRIIYSGRELDDRFTLRDYRIEPEFYLHLVRRVRSSSNRLVLSTRTLAPQFDYDFTRVEDDGVTFIRGGEPYRRPCGWMRFALEVQGQFENDIWLGADGIRTGSSEGEWPVSYHATGAFADETMAQTGCRLATGREFGFRHGIYSTPDFEVAQRYANTFNFEGRRFAIIFQNRVKPTALRKLGRADEETGEFWLNPNHFELRPYGILIKQL
eukprot:g6300.t1